MSEQLKTGLEPNPAESIPAEPNPAVTEPIKPATAEALSALREILVEYGAKDPDVTLVNLQELGVESVEDLSSVKESELIAAGLNTIKARKLLAFLTAANVPTPKTAPASAPVPQLSFLNNAIFDVPSDESYLADLKTGGILKCGRSAYISAIRAVVANRINVRDVPKKVYALIEQYYEDNGEQVPELYWELRKQATRRQYSDIFSAIGGASAVSDAQRQKLIGKTKDYVFPVLVEAKNRLSTFVTSYTETAQINTSLAVANSLSAGISGGTFPGMPLPATTPDFGPLRDIGDDLRNALNRALSGIGPTVAATMACDYIEVRKILNNPSLPAHTGTVNREQLFRKLDIDVPASLIRAENDLVRFVLAFAQNDQIPADQELAFYLAVAQISQSLDLSMFGVTNATEGKSYTNLVGNRF